MGSSPIKFDLMQFRLTTNHYPRRPIWLAKCNGESLPSKWRILLSDDGGLRLLITNLSKAHREPLNKTHERLSVFQGEPNSMRPMEDLTKSHEEPSTKLIKNLVDILKT